MKVCSVSQDYGDTYWQRYAYFVVFFFPLALLDVRIPLAGMIIRLSDIYLIILVGMLFLSGWEAQRWVVRCLWLFTPFIAYVALSALVTKNLPGLLESFQWILTLLWIPVCSYVLRQADIGLMKLLWACILAVALYTALNHMAQGYFYGFKHMAGAKYSFGLAMLVGLLLYGRVNWLLWLSTIPLCVALLILSDERKGVLFNAITVIGFVPFLMLVHTRAKLAGIYILLLLVLFSTGPILYFSFVQDNLAATTFVDEEIAVWSSDLHRQSLIANGMDIFLQNPLFGAGAKKLSTLMGEYYLESALGLSTHNFYLDFLIEYGLIGLLLFLPPLIMIAMSVRLDHPLGFILLPLGFYCLCVPMFMESGTTTMITLFTGVACVLACGWRPKEEVFVARINPAP